MTVSAEYLAFLQFFYSSIPCPRPNAMVNFMGGVYMVHFKLIS